MDKEAVITPDIVRQQIRYEPETGHLYWRVRNPKDHPDVRPHNVENFNFQHAGKRAGSVCAQGYIQLKISHNGRGFMFKGHRVAWAAYYGKWPEKTIDHINGKRADNRIANLRDVSHVINSRNRARHPKNTSGHWGVRWVKGAWEAKFRTSSENFYLGRFPTKEEAAKAVREKAREVGGFTERHGVDLL